ncbi:DUF1620-domain-containing protein [Tricholoma matsutake]|nr:DUF1620-domain-containing protein [Tricholoma matsutake 945]
MAIEQAYVFPFVITAMVPTSTKFGITNKDLIEEQEEFLVSYEPILAYDPRRVLSHNYEVANTQRIITAPALLQSTSLVFAYGLDMFLTRVAPSNTFDVLSEDFNKMQLVFTIT